MSKLEQFAAKVEAIEVQQYSRLVKVPEEEVRNSWRMSAVKVKIVPGRKYTKVDVGDSGRYMVENSTGKVYGILAYGRVNKGHYFGTLDELTA